MLTIAIPTYNREKQLIQTLKNLEKQTNQDFNIFISDNASDYNIEKSISDNFNDDFLRKITINVRNINIHADNNIVGMFECVKNGWMWIVSDDDFEKDTAVECIYYYINKYPDYAIIQFSFFKYLDKPLHINSLQLFIKSLYKKVNRSSAVEICGDFCSSLNKVYNLNKLKDVIGYGFDGIYTCMTTGLIMLYALERGYDVLICTDIIAEFGPAFWNVKNVAVRARTIGDFEFNLSEVDKRKLLYIVNVPYRMPLHYWITNGDLNDKFLEKLYYGFYRYHLPLKDRLDYYIRMKLFSILLFYKLHMFIKNIEYKLRKSKI